MVVSGKIYLVNVQISQAVQLFHLTLTVLLTK